MSTISVDPLEQLIRAAGEDHLIDWYSPRNEALPNLHNLLHAADQRARERLGSTAPRLTADQLILEQKRNPQKVQAFLQILGTASPDMLVMAWRVMQGMGVQAIQMEFETETRFTLRIRLASPYGDQGSEEYETNDISDAVVLRHLGVMKISGRPVFDGFYGLNVKRSSGSW